MVTATKKKTPEVRGRRSGSKNGHASREAGHVLSTVTPAGIAALDPAAAPSPRSPAPSPSLNDTRSLQADRLVQNDPHERRPYDVPLASLGRSRFNPRERFDEAELQEMAQSLVKYGQIQPLVIRHLSDGVTVPSLADPQRSVACEIVAGERRALAALKAGWARINVMAITCDDARACELAIAENRDRKDISQVEYARGLQRLADLKGLDPAALAADQRLSEQHVRNLFRLLKAPVEWQQRVIDGEIDGTHLRDAAPFLQYPRMAERLAKELKGFKAKPTHTEWERAVRNAVHEIGHGLGEYVHNSDYSKSATVNITPTHPRYAELEVVEVADYGGGKVKLALNSILADEILREKAAEWRNKHPAKKSKAAAGGTEKAAAKRRKADEKVRERTERLQGIVVFWQCWLCARAIECPLGELHHSDEVAVRAITAAALGMCDLPAREALFDDFARERFTPKKSKIFRTGDGSAPLLALDADGFEKLGMAAAARLFWDDSLVKHLDDTWFYYDPDWGPEIDRWCKALAVKPAAAWRAKGDDGKQAFLGPLTEAWLDLHDRDQLAEVAAEWKVPVLEKDSEADLRRKLTGNASRVMPMPAELAELLRGRRSEARGQGKKKPR